MLQSARAPWDTFTTRIHITMSPWGIILSLCIIRINRNIMFIYCPNAFSQVMKWTVLQMQLTTSTVHIPHVSLTLLYSTHCLHVDSLDNCVVKLVPRIELPLSFLCDTAPVWKCWVVVYNKPIQYFFASSHRLVCRGSHIVKGFNIYIFLNMPF